jgi:hypothetical protein
MQCIAYDTFAVDCSINMVSPVPENKTPYNVLEENDLNIS